LSHWRGVEVEVLGCIVRSRDGMIPQLCNGTS
jgi:hypothetical protein